jgi:hypothetical protein
MLTRHRIALITSAWMPACAGMTGGADAFHTYHPYDPQSVACTVASAFTTAPTRAAA